MAILRKLGVGNLRLLCERSQLPKADDAAESTLSTTLLDNADVSSIIHLREFMRRRTQWIEAVFDNALPPRVRKGIDADLEELSSRRKEILKPFTKLLLLYRDDPKWLAEIYQQAEWYSRGSVFEYVANNDLPRNTKRTLVANFAQIAKTISNTLGRGVQALAVHELLDDTIIGSFLREYATVVKPDFEEQYTVHHGCGLLLFGIAPAQRKVVVKCGNRGIATAVISNLQELLHTEFRVLKNDVYSEFDGDELRQRLLGSFSSDFGLDVTAGVIRRTSLPGRPKLTLTASPYSNSLREALVSVRDQRIAEVYGPSDIESLTFSFRGREAIVKAETVKEGAVRFNFDNSGWDPTAQEEFEEAFQNTFGIPVNRLLDPSRITLGTEGLFAHLLSIRSEDEVSSYQEDYFNQLIESGILVHRTMQARVCRNGICADFGRMVTDESQQICRRCDEELHDQPVQSVERSIDTLASVVGECLKSADGWSIENQKELDGHSYHPISKRLDSGSQGTVCVLFHDRLRTDTKLTFKRTGLPLLVVHGTLAGGRLLVDDEGIGHLSFAHLLAARQDAATAPLYYEECRSIIKSLLLRHDDRIAQAASISRDRLVCGTNGLDGDDYEDDVFNILRSLFPYTYRLGRKGKVEPDGYVCLPDYETNSLRNVGSWNWSYDAKLTGRKAGYDFGIDEHRKVVQYIRKLNNNRRALFGEKQRPRAHIIISNNVSEQKMRGAAAHVFGTEGVGDQGRDIRFILMQQEFLLSLHDSIRQHSDLIRRRRPFVERYLIELFEATPVGGYAILESAHAAKIIQNVLACPEIESNVNGHDLLESLQ